MLPKRVSLGYATTLLGVVGALLNNLWLLAAVADEVSKDELGLYLFAAATIGYFALTQLGLDAASSQRIAEAIGREEPEQANRVYHQILFFNNIVSLTAVLVTVIAAVAVWFFATEELRSLTIWIVASTGLGTAFRLFANPARAALNGSGNVHIVGMVGLMSNLLTPILGYVMLKAGAGVLCLPFSQFVMAGLAMLILHIQRIRTCRWSLDDVVDRWNGFKSLFQFGVGVSGSIALAMVVATCEPLLFKIAGSEALLSVAVYHVWFRFPAMTFVLSSGLTSNSGPALATAYAADPAKGVQFFHRIFWIATSIGAICTFAIVSWLTPFVHHWLGGKYDVETSTYIALGFGVLIGFRAIMFSVASMFYPLNRIRNVVSGYGVQAASKIVLGLCLIPFFGVAGMVWAYTIATLFSALWLMSLLVKSDVMPTSFVAGSLGTVVASACIGSGLAHFTSDLQFNETVLGIGVTSVLLAGLVAALLIYTRKASRKIGSAPTPAVTSES